MRRDRGIVPIHEQQPREADERRVHVRLRWVRDFARLVVRALDETHARAEAIEPRRVRLAAPEIRLQHRARVAIPLLPHRLEHVERDVGVRRVLHVHADEEVARHAGIEDSPQVVHAGRAIDRQPELRELQRDVARDPRGRDALHHAEVGTRRGVRFRDRADALAEIIERHAETLAFERPRDGDRFVDGFAGDEPAREAVRAAHAVSGCEALQVPAAGEGLKESLRERVDHQWVRNGRRGAESRCCSDRA